MPPTDADYALVAKVAEWMTGLSEEEQANDYLSNLGTYGRVGLVNEKGMGLVASAIVAYQRQFAATTTREASSEPVSQYVGKIGERMRLRLRLLEVREHSGFYGMTYIHKFADETGNVFVWFGSGNLFEDGVVIKPGHTLRWTKFTVKKHEEFRGVLQTTVSRCELTVSEEEEKMAKRAAAKAKRDAKKVTA